MDSLSITLLHGANTIPGIFLFLPDKSHSIAFAAEKPISTCPGCTLESGGDVWEQRNSSLSTPRIATDSGTRSPTIPHASSTWTARQSHAAIFRRKPPHSFGKGRVREEEDETPRQRRETERISPER